MKLDTVVYFIRYRIPPLYRIIEGIGSCITIVRFNRRISQTRENSAVVGKVEGRYAEIRYIGVDDTSSLLEMIDTIPAEHLRFFSPHRMDYRSLRRVLRRRDVMTYGLFIEDRMTAYALLKLFPTGRAYIGRLISSALTGIGLGKFLSRYLYWQSRMLGFRPCSTIHDDNIASLRSHAAVRSYTVSARLSDGFNLVEFTLTNQDDEKPELLISCD